MWSARRFLLLMALAAWGAAQDKSVQPIVFGRKVALVIGNSNYRYIAGVPPAANDADDMAAALHRLRFEVVDVRKDLTADGLIEEVGRFSRTRVQPGDLALIYYSGHGGQVGEENYLLPVDYDPPSNEDLVERRAYKMSRARDALEGGGARVRVLIFDACRNSPVTTSKSGVPGLRGIEGRPEGTLIAFASAHNQVARYQTGERNSFYTGELIAALARAEDFKSMLEDVQHRVFEATEHRQTPYLYGFLSAPLYLGDRPAVAGGLKLDAAAEAWVLVKDSRNPEDFDGFAQMFPSSELARTAQLQATLLRRAAMVAVKVPPANRPGTTKVNSKDGLPYVWIPPGTFTMGCSAGDTECSDQEKPAHQVTITKGFWIGRTDVTQEAYQRVTGNNPSDFKGAKLPVETINWNEAQSYCQAVGMRLPTEAEWEYAARAGSTGARYGNLDAVAWYSANSGGKTHEVAQKEPNAWGLYDMLGNVYQWMADWFDEKYSGGSQGDPGGPPAGQYRALRGGSWYNYPRYVRASYRNRDVPGLRLSYVGVRCAGN